MKRAVKFTLMITGIVSLCFSCLFSKTVYAATTTNLRVPYTQTRWVDTYLVDKEYVYNEFEFITDYTNLRAYIEDGTGSATDNIDDSVPTFIVCDTSLHTNSNAIPMNSRCIPFDDFSSLALNSNAYNNINMDVVSALLGLTPTYQYSLASIDYRTLYLLGYRISAYCQTTYTYNGSNGNVSGTCYLYTLNKYRGSDRINFLNTVTDSDGTISSSTNYTTVYEYFERWDFDVFNMIDRTENQNHVDYDSSGYITTSIGWLYKDTDAHEKHIYQTNDLVPQLTVSYDNYNNAYYTLQITITGPNPYIITYFNSENYNPGSMIENTYTTIGNVPGVQYSGAGNDLTSINQHLVNIEDLLSDLEVQVVNEIYNDITNEYNVDIDLTLNNIIDDLSDNITSFDFTDEDYQIPETDLQKISGFRLIFSNMINTMNANGLGLMWFLPLVLLILGALL